MRLFSGGHSGETISGYQTGQNIQQVWALWSATLQVLHSDIDFNGHFVCQVVDFNRIIWIVTNVYGYNSKVENEILFDTIEQKFPSIYLLISRNFNVAFDDVLDRWPSRQNNNVSCYLKLFMQRFDLIEIWREKWRGIHSERAICYRYDISSITSPTLRISHPPIKTINSCCWRM